MGFGVGIGNLLFNLDFLEVVGEFEGFFFVENIFHFYQLSCYSPFLLLFFRLVFIIYI